MAEINPNPESVERMLHRVRHANYIPSAMQSADESELQRWLTEFAAVRDQVRAATNVASTIDSDIDWRPETFWGMDAATIERTATAKITKRKRRAGVRGMVRKYGKSAATEIIRDHSGRTIR